MRSIGKLLSLVLSVLFFITMYMVYKLNMLPMKYYLLIGGVLLFIILGLDFKLIRKKTGVFSRVFFSLISVIFIGVIVYLLTYINATYNFMNSMVLNQFDTITYDVVVKKDSNISKIGNLENKEMGYLASDKNYSKLKLLIRKDIKYEDVKYKTIDTLMNSVVSGDIPSIVIEDSYYDLLKEENTSLKNSTKIIKKYKLIVKKEVKEKKSSTSDPFILYISGIDTYGKITSVSRSDVNILAVVNPKREKILLVSIPRDYYVQLHGTTGSKDKLTHAGIYGIDMSVSTIEDLLDQDIDYYLRMNFSTLTKTIDLMDGIDVYSDVAFTAHTNRSVSFKEGMNHMNGEEALAFARERYAYKSGDRHRGENQQAIITAIIKKMTQPSNIMKYKTILSSLEGTFETDMSYDNITNLVKIQLKDNIDWDIESISLNGVGSYQKTYSMGNRNLYVMIPDDDTVMYAKKRIEQVLGDVK